MSRLRDRAELLRRQSAALEPDRETRRAVTDAVMAHGDRFLEALREGPSYYPPTGSPGITGLDLAGDGRPIGELLDLVRREVEEQGLNPASPRDFGWVPGGGVHAAALGDYLAAVGNEFAGYYPASPGATLLENRMVEWIAELVGYSGDAGGTLTSGGSVAALTAVIAARDARGLRARDFPRAVVYVSSQEHYSVRKAVHLAGLREAQIRTLPVDRSYRFAPEALRRQVAADRDEGLIPWLVVTSAGTTNTGAVDPLAAVCDIAEAENLWHHVDAAYGGFYLLVPARRALFEGIERADSIVLDPHKSLFIPYGLGAVVVRDAAHLETFRFDAAYLVDGSQPAPSPSERSVELTRHFRAMRMFLPLALHGRAAFAAALEEKWVLARVLQEELESWPEIEVGPPPELSTMCFRWGPRGMSPEQADEANRMLLERFHADGRIFFTATILDGRFWMRPSLGIFRTHLRHVDEFLTLLRQFLDEAPMRPEERRSGAGASP